MTEIKQYSEAEIRAGRAVAIAAFELFEWALPRMDLWEEILAMGEDSPGELLVDLETEYDLSSVDKVVRAHIEKIGLVLLKMYRSELFKSSAKKEAVIGESGLAFFPVIETARNSANQTIAGLDAAIVQKPEEQITLKDNEFILSLEPEVIIGDLTSSQRMRAKRLYQATLICWRVAMTIQTPAEGELMQYLDSIEDAN